MGKTQVFRGNQLRRCRQNKQLTLKELSEKTGISVSYLSKIEQGIVNPSASNIQKICYALGITENELIEPKPVESLLSTIHEDTSYVLRSNERCLLYDFADSVRLESIYEGNPHFKFNVMTISNAAHPMTSVHTYDEFGVVTEGSMSIELEGIGRFDLEKGDSIMIRARTQHTIVSTSSAECISYWIQIPSSQNASQ